MDEEEVEEGKVLQVIHSYTPSADNQTHIFWKKLCPGVGRLQE
jgi:hypothetical protein